MKLAEITDKLITITLAHTNGNKRKAAKELGMPERSLHRLIKKRIERDNRNE